MKKNILIVEDEADIRKVTKIRLEAAGYEVDEASDGKEALNLLKNKIYDLLLIDLIMPGMDGKELCKNLKNDENLKNIPILLFTALSTGSMEELTKKLQANDYIIKPFNPKILIAKVKTYLGE